MQLEMRRRRWVCTCLVAALISWGFGGTSSLLGQERIDAPGTQHVKPFGQPQSLAPSIPQSELPPSRDYKIGPEDVLRIDVFQVPELSKLEVRVSNDGTITVPLLGRVQAAGMTVGQLGRKLEIDWGKTYLQNPEVNVFVEQFQAEPVTVLGEVAKPGPYYLTGPRTLLEVLGMAGGLSNQTSGDPGPGPTLTITRQGGFGGVPTVPGMELVAPNQLKIELSKLLNSSQTGLNIPIRPLDVITVSKAGLVYVAGRGVRQPGAYVLSGRQSVTVIEAIAIAQGLDSNAARRFARIIRQGPDGKKIQIPVNLDKVEKGQAPDPTLTATDILFVPDSKQMAALKRALETTMTTVSGMLVFGRF